MYHIFNLITSQDNMFADLVIIGAVLIVSCKYIVEAFTKFKAILEVTPKNEIGAKYPDEK